MAFDVEGARKAGYNDAEIAQFLAEQSGFDYAGATKAGYDPSEIVGFLSKAPKPKAKAEPTTPSTDFAYADPMTGMVPGEGLPTPPAIPKKKTAAQLLEEPSTEPVPFTKEEGLLYSSKKEIDRRNAVIEQGKRIQASAIAKREAQRKEAKAENYDVVDFAKDTGLDVAKGVVGLGEAYVGLLNLTSGGAAGEVLGKMKYSPKKTNDFLSGLQSLTRQEADRSVQEAVGFVDTLQSLAVNPAALIGSVAESLPGTVLAGATGGQFVRFLASKAANEALALGLTGDAAQSFIADRIKQQTLSIAAVASGAEGLQSTGSIAEAGRQAGKEWSDYVLPALSAGFGTAAIGIVSGKAAQKLGIGDIETDIAARSAGIKGVGTGEGPFVKKFFKEIAKEGFLEEMPQSAQEQIFQNLATGRPWDEGVDKAAAQGLVAGIAMAGGHAGGAELLQRASKYATAKEPVYDYEALARSKGFTTELPKTQAPAAPPPTAPEAQAPAAPQPVAQADVEQKIAALVAAGIPEDDARAMVSATKGVTDVGQAVTEPSGEGAGVAGVPSTEPTAGGVGEAEPTGVVRTAETPGQPAGGEAAAPGAVEAKAEAAPSGFEKQTVDANGNVAAFKEENKPWRFTQRSIGQVVTFTDQGKTHTGTITEVTAVDRTSDRGPTEILRVTDNDPASGTDENGNPTPEKWTLGNNAIENVEVPAAPAPTVTEAPKGKRGRPATLVTPEQKAASEERRKQQRLASNAASRQVDALEAQLNAALTPIDTANIESEEELRQAEADKRRAKVAAMAALYDFSKTNKNKPGQRAAELLKNPAITAQELEAVKAGHAIRKQAATAAAKVAPSQKGESKGIDPANKSLSKVTNGAQAVSVILRTGSFFQKLLAFRIRGFVNNVKVVVIEKGDPLPETLTKGYAAQEWPRSRGLFVQDDAAGTRTVYLRGESEGNDQGVNNATVLHELLHAATVQKLYLAQKALELGFSTDANLTRAYEELLRVMRVAQEQFLALGGKNSARVYNIFQSTDGAVFTDPKEFLAYGMTDPDIQRFLAQTQDIAPAERMFSRFVDAIRRFFNLAEDQHTALSNLIDVTDKILNARKTADMQLLQRLEGEAARRKQAEPTKVAAQASETEAEDDAAKKAASEARKQGRRVDVAIAKFEASDNASKAAENATLLKALRNGDDFIRHINAVFSGLDKARLSAMLFALPTDVVASWGESNGVRNLNKIYDTIGKMHGLSKQLLVAAGNVNESMVRAIKKDPELRRKLERIAYVSTIARVDPSFNKSSAELNKMWDALGPEGQRIYNELKGYYESMVNYYGHLLDQQIDASKLDPGAKKTLMATIRQMYEIDKRIVPFFPLVRNQGELWLSFGKRNKRQFITFKNDAQRAAVLDMLAKKEGQSVEEFIADNEVKQGDTLESFRSHVVEASDMLKKVFEKIDAAKSLNDNAVQKLKDSIYELYLATLPEQSFRRGFISRKDVVGFNTDIVRNFSTTATRMATQLARIKYSNELRNTLIAAEASLEGNPDQPKLMRFVEDMKRRVEMELNPYGERVRGLSRAALKMIEGAGNTLSRLAFVHYLSAAGSAMVQLTQILFAAANLGARHGYTNTAIELTKLMKFWDEFGIRQNNADGTVSFVAPTMAQSKRVSLNADEQRAVNEMLGRGVSEITLTNEMLGRSQVPSAEYQSGFNKTKRIFWTAVGGLFHTAERVSREITFMTSYRLSRKEGKTHEQAVDQAVADTYDSVGNMAQWNRPPIMRGPTGRVATQFLMYPLFMTTRLAKTFVGMLPLLNKEGKMQALKEFGGIMGVTWMLAGVAGLPLFSTIMGIVGAALRGLDDKDKPEDLKSMNFELWFRTVFMPDLVGKTKVFGKDLADIIERGPANAFTGLDIAGRTSLNDLWFRDTKETRTPREGAVNTAIEHAGPAANLILSYLDAYQAIADGDNQKAAEKALPSILRGPTMAMKYMREGAKDFKGAQILSKDAFSTGDLFFQAIGLRTDALANHQKVLFDMAKIENGIRFNRDNIVNNISDAYIKQDERRFRDKLGEMQKFNAKYPTFSIDGDAISRAIETRMGRAASSMRGFVPTEKNIQLVGPAIARSLKALEEKEAAARK